MVSIGVGDLDKVTGRLAGRIAKTPLLSSPSLDDVLGTRVLLKAECFQRSGCFKMRGALNALLAGLERGDDRGVLAITTGNHALAVALAARETGVPATLVMPQGGPPLKRAAARQSGAAVVTDGVTPKNREEVGYALLEERGLRWLHPFNDPDVIAGQATVGLEIVEQAAVHSERIDTVLVPVGGGGLIAGISEAVAARAPHARVIGVQPETADHAARSLRAGEVISVASRPTSIADAANHVELGELPWRVISERVSEILTVSEESIAKATWALWHHAKMLAEPTAALPVAAVLERRVDLASDKALACVISGGNVDAIALAPRLERWRDGELAASAADRYSSTA
jgi:threonine dehydratase